MYEVPEHSRSITAAAAHLCALRRIAARCGRPRCSARSQLGCCQSLQTGTDHWFLRVILHS